MTNKMIGVSDFQIVDRGERVRFCIDGPDQEFTQFEIAATDIPAVIRAFVDVWAAVEAEAAGLKGVPTWKLAEAPSATYAPASGLIVLEIQPDLKAPLLATITRTQAQEAIRSLQAAVEAAPMGPASATLN